MDSTRADRLPCAGDDRQRGLAPANHVRIRAGVLEIKMPEKLTVLDSFKAAIVFIETFFYRNEKPDDIVVLLGAMNLTTEPNPLAFTIESQGYEPLDRGVWAKWLRAIDLIIPETNHRQPRQLSIEEAYKATYLFIQTWYEVGLKSEEPFRILLENMELWKNNKLLDIDEWLPDAGEPKDPMMWTNWLNAIKSVCEK